MADIFTDGFESGDFTAWTGTSSNEGGQPTVQSGVIHTGTYAMQCVLSANGYQAWTYKDITSANTVYIRAYVRFSKIPVSGEAYNNIIDCYRVSDSFGGLSIRIVPDGSGGALFRAYNNYYGTTDDGSACVINTWYCVETKNTNTGAENWWVDGVDQGSCGNGAVAMDRVRVGFWHIVGSTSSTMQIDCVVVADAYIGPEAAAGGQQLFTLINEMGY